MINSDIHKKYLSDFFTLMINWSFYHTVEGLIEKIQDNLDERNPFADSDSEFNARMKSLLEDLAQLRQGGRKFTMILRDPLAHSFLQNPCHPNADPRATR